MIVLTFLLAALVSQAPAPASAPTETPAPVVEPYPGTLAEGLHEVRRLAETGEHAPARELATRLLAPTPFLRWKERALAAGGWRGSTVRAVEPVLDALGLEALSPRARAEVRYASGTAAAGAEDRPAAASEFDSARALAGPGALRLAAGYQLATNALLEAEALRLQIPELQPQGAAAPGAASASPAPPGPGVPALPGAPAGAPSGAPAGPDPLEVARAAYLRARERCVERLSADWTDADTRANTELVMKRLRELDELEKKREEEKQKQEQEKNQDPEQQKDSKDKQDQKDPSKDKQDEKQDDPKDAKPDEKADEKPPEEQPKPEDESKDGEQKDAQQPEPAEERELSKEELTRLLDLLKQREQQWKKLQQQIHQARRAKVKKDW